jgi:hypothetical protein
MEQIEINVAKNIEEVEINVQPNVTQVIINEVNGGGGVKSVTGNIVDNTDPLNPVVDFTATDYDLEDFTNTSADPFVRESELPSPTVPTLQEVTDAGAVTTADIKVNSLLIYEEANDEYISLNAFDDSVLIKTILDNKNIVRFSQGVISFFNEDDFIGSFVNSDLTGNRGYDLPDKSGTIALTNDLSSFVPYTGATQNVNLGEFGADAGFIKLDTTPTGTPTGQGTMAWDVDNETISVILNGYKMLIGEDQFYPVKNQTGSTINKGTNVKFAGTLGASGRLLVAPFLADGTDPSYVYMGVAAENILNGQDGKVLWFGRLRGINTNAFEEGDILYASTTSAGGFQTAIPTGSNNVVQVAAVINKSSTQGVIFIRPQIEPVQNQNKATFTVELIDDLSVDIYAPFDLKINVSNVIVGIGTITIEVNDSAYTLGNLIDQGDKITVSTTTASVVNLEVRYE